MSFQSAHPCIAPGVCVCVCVCVCVRACVRACVSVGPGACVQCVCVVRDLGVAVHVIILKASIDCTGNICNLYTWPIILIQMHRNNFKQSN